MARKLRIHYEKAIYHVIARGNNKEDIFIEDKDKNKYLDLLAKYKERYGFELYSYVLMDNHFHLLMSVNETPLAKIMQGIQQSYTQYFNRKYLHVGHVFQQRYKAFLCNNDSYLLTLVCYIHQNPCRAKLPEGLSYIWSSHKDYLAGNSELVNTLFVLSMLAENMTQAIARYANFVVQEQDKPTIAVEKIPNVKTIKCGVSLDEVEDKSSHDVVSKQIIKSNFDDIAKNVSEEMQVPLEQLLGRCRIRKVVEARNILIFRVIEDKICTRVELARKLGVDPAIISRSYQRMQTSRNKISQI